MSLEDRQSTPAERTKAAWNTQGRFWEYNKDKPIELNQFFTNFYRQHRDEIKDVLDIGCGPGRYLVPMVQDGKQVVGLDIADQTLVGAEANLKEAGLEGRARLIEGVSTHLDFPDESFDFVLAKGSIHHNTWQGIQQSVKEVARVLRPGMFFLFQARSDKDPALARSELIPDVGKTARGVKFGEKDVIEHYFAKEELEQLAQENGFEIVVEPEEQLGEEGKRHARWWVVYRKL